MWYKSQLNNNTSEIKWRNLQINVQIHGFNFNPGLYNECIKPKGCPWMILPVVIYIHQGGSNKYSNVYADSK